MKGAPPLLIVVPLYRNAGLLSGLARSLTACADELERAAVSILLINDSPDDADLVQALARELPALRERYTVELRQNERNIGFVGSANRGFETALARGCDVLLLNSDTIVFPGALRELRAVAYLDPMIGFANPRSNNATIASLPPQRSYAGATPEQAFARFQTLSRYLPRVRYAPTAVGFCLYVKLSVLREFGLFDPLYGQGYNEENDLIMRANRCGYRAVLANKAFVYHIGEQSFALTQAPTHARDAANRAILDQRYPEYSAAVADYFHSSAYKAEALLTGLLPMPDGRRRLAIDGSNLGSYHSGTSEAGVELFRHIVREWADAFEITIFCSAEALRFHGLDRVPGLRHSASPEDGAFAAVLRFGQPFRRDTVGEFLRRAPVTLLFMLDTIALDCSYIGIEAPQLHLLWQHALGHCDAVFYNSAFTQQQFAARFDIPAHVIQVAALHSLAVAEYRARATDVPPAEPHILLIGNHYDHKFIAPTVAKLLQATSAPIAVLGTTLAPSARIKSFQSGSLQPDEIDRLYAGASVIGYPSHYEGFGLPLMHALAHQKPIVARRIPVFEEIIAGIGGNPNIHLADSTDEMVALMASGALKWTPSPPRDDAQTIGWVRSAHQLRAALDHALGQVDYRRLTARLDMAEILDPADKADLVPPSDLDIRADLAARYLRAPIRLALQIPGVTALGQLIVRSARVLRNLGRAR